MRVLSLFDGIGAARLAISQLNINPIYFSSEIDKWAIKVLESNFNNIIQLGDVNSIDHQSLPPIDLMIGGSPCTKLSGAGRGERGFIQESALFFKYVELLKLIQPTYFVFENVASMSKKHRQVITDALEVELVLIDSALLTAQTRKRYYWANFRIKQPEDLGIKLSDILETNIDIKYLFSDKSKKYILQPHRLKYQYHSEETSNKSRTVIANFIKGAPNNVLFCKNGNIRKFTPIEVERLQGFPDNYTTVCSDSQRYRLLGNSFTVPIIKHILSQIPNIKDFQCLD